MRKILLIGFLSLFSFSGVALSSEISSSWIQTKNKIYKKIYPNHGETFYCQCDWTNRRTELATCGLETAFEKKYNKRSKRTEVEHVVPASFLLKKDKKFRQCYYDAKSHKESARQYCLKHDAEYAAAHNDMNNLRIAIGSINGIRSNKTFIENTRPGTRSFGSCKTKIDSRSIAPRPEIRGDIARVYFYMFEQYKFIPSKRQQALLEKWNQEDPIDRYEYATARRIKDIQGKGNRFVLDFFSGE